MQNSNEYINSFKPFVHNTRDKHSSLFVRMTKKKSLSVPAVSRVAGRPPRQKDPRGLENAMAGIFVFKVDISGTSSSVSSFGWDGSQ
jgi:hypothetical protein